MIFSITSNGDLSHEFKEGNRNYACYIKRLPENLLDVECSKCHKLCQHILNLAQHYSCEPTALSLFENLWLYEKVNHKTFTKAWVAIEKTYIQNVEPNMLSAIVDGNGDTYSVMFEDKKKYCACIYGKSDKGMCYHQVATLLAAISQKKLSMEEVKVLF